MDYQKLIEKAQNKANKLQKQVYVIEDIVDGYYFVTTEDIHCYNNDDIFFSVFPKKV